VGKNTEVCSGAQKRGKNNQAKSETPTLSDGGHQAKGGRILEGTVHQQASPEREPIFGLEDGGTLRGGVSLLGGGWKRGKVKK